MVEANTQNSDERLYLDDVFLRERFTSRTHVIDEAQIKAFAQQQTPSVKRQDSTLPSGSQVVFQIGWNALKVRGLFGLASKKAIKVMVENAAGENP